MGYIGKGWKKSRAQYDNRSGICACGVKLKPPKPYGSRGVCPDCTRKNRLQRYHNRSLNRYYGLTPEQYNDKFISQLGCCAICGTHQSQLVKRLAVDHNHKTKRFRSLLCTSCNLGLGKFKENPELLRKAIQYLESTDHDLQVVAETKMTA